MKSKDAYILDNFVPFAAPLTSLLISSNKFENVFSCTDEEALFLALEPLSKSKILYLFLDYELLKKKIVSVFQKIRNLPYSVKIIILCNTTNPKLLNDLLKLGPDSVVHKADKPYDIINCIENMSRDNAFYSGIILTILREESEIKAKSKFTARERELLNLWARGYSVEKTANLLALSFHTVTAHKKNMFKKAKCRSLPELLIYAKKKRILQ